MRGEGCEWRLRGTRCRWDAGVKWACQIYFAAFEIRPRADCARRKKGVQSSIWPPCSKRGRNRKRQQQVVASLYLNFALEIKYSVHIQPLLLQHRRNESVKTITMADGPSAKVFAIPELLEQILLHLPQQDILRYQRMNSTFRDAIKQSKDIQTKLFIKLQHPHAKPSTFHDTTLNPLAGPLLDAYGKEMNMISFPYSDEPHVSISVSRARFMHVNDLDCTRGSWREMWASDPPCEFHIAFRSGHICLPAMKLSELHDNIAELRDNFIAIE